MATAPVQDTTGPACPCGCGRPVAPKNHYAGRGCYGRARKGKSVSPEVLAQRTARKAEPPTVETASMAPGIGLPGTDPYALVAELARVHDARTLRAAADLREALGGKA